MDNTMKNEMENKVESQGHFDYNVGDFFDLLYLLPSSKYSAVDGKHLASAAAGPKTNDCDTH